jgi:23S rRNA (adenine2503-C2)-methyltransferase
MMKIIKSIEVPTGNILIGKGDTGRLEFLSLGDYGKDVNLNPAGRVEHTSIMPLSDKWVITISTQYGCNMQCAFCDVSRVQFRGNATFNDLIGQVKAAMSLHPEITRSKRLNIHFARMGEPTWNFNVLSATMWLAGNLQDSFHIHPVVSTMMPVRNHQLLPFLQQWMRIKNDCLGGEAGLQLSINSTNEGERLEIFGKCSMSLVEISDSLALCPRPKGRKITLNFAVADWEIDPDVLLQYFSPSHYIVKLTPMHKTARATENDIKTYGDYTDPYPYEHHAEALRKAGYEVLVFVASREEDESRITCGNAILASDKGVKR